MIEDNENKRGEQGTRKEIKEELKQQKAERRLRKEDIESDLKDNSWFSSLAKLAASFISIC